MAGPTLMACQWCLSASVQSLESLSTTDQLGRNLKGSAFWEDGLKPLRVDNGVFSGWKRLKLVDDGRFVGMG